MTGHQTGDSRKRAAETTSDPSPHETPEAEASWSLTATERVLLHVASARWFGVSQEYADLCIDEAVEQILDARKADPARDAKLRAEGAQAVRERVEAVMADWLDRPYQYAGIKSAAGCAAYDLRAALTEAGGESKPLNIADTCCGKCPGDTCYVDQVTGA